MAKNSTKRETVGGRSADVPVSAPQNGRGFDACFEHEEIFCSVDDDDRPACQICGNFIEEDWELEIFPDTGLCPYHAHQVEKDDDDWQEGQQLRREGAT